MVRYVGTLLVTAGLIAGVVTLLGSSPGLEPRVASLRIAPHDFDDSGPVPGLVASLRSSSDSDTKASIDLYWTVPGGTEAHGAEASTRRRPGDPALALRHALLASEFPSGTSVRAVFHVSRGVDSVATLTRTTVVP